MVGNRKFNEEPTVNHQDGPKQVAVRPHSGSVDPSHAYIGKARVGTDCRNFLRSKYSQMHLFLPSKC